ncbi:MAG TPA: hypothetical protein VNW92_08120, partial [Polyangiaceae bacterium]|nr:hypothetical protein [Polyangiaceae bacterium]
AERYDEDVWHQAIAAFVRNRPTVRTHELLAELGVEVARMGGENAKRVGAIMLQLGWEQGRRRTGGLRERLWTRSAKAQALFDVEQRFRAASDNVVPLRAGSNRGVPTDATSPDEDSAEQEAPPASAGIDAPSGKKESVHAKDWSLE